MSSTSEARHWLNSSQMFGIKLGLENIHRLLEAIGNPHLDVPCIHVAGTNGKGSVCSLLESILREAGHSTGLYTSPHLIHFSERIKICGQPIPETDMEDGLRLLKSVSENWKHSPTFFEISTALAFWWFRNQCGISIIETGMGGRLDATNVVIPETSVITPIALDHSKWLGSSIAEIAAEKAGIIKPGHPVVSAIQHPDAEQIITTCAQKLGSPLRFATSPCELPVSLPGEHQRWNAALAILALESAKIPIPSHALTSGLANALWPGRFQKVGGQWILDGAHNPHAAQALVSTWQSHYGDLKTSVIFACMADKEAASILKILEPITSDFHFVPVENDRAILPAELCLLTGHPSQAHASLQDAIKRVKNSPRPPSHRNPALITGSLFLIGEAINWFEKFKETAQKSFAESD